MPNSSEDPVVAHKDYFLTDAQRALAETIQEPLKLVLVAIAIPLALCNVIVFSQKSMRSASACYIIGLNCGQLVYVVSHTVLYTWHQFVDPPYSQFSYCQYLRYVSLYGGVLIGKRGSYIVLVVASIERLYAVLRPLHIRNFFLARRPVLTVVVIYALAAVLHAYQFARSKMVMVTHPVTGISVCNLVKTDLYQRHQHVNDFFSLLAKAIFSYSSLALQLVLNILTVWALRRHNMASKHVTSSTNEDAKRQQERQLTVTLLGASISYLILSLPGAFLNVFQTTSDEFQPRGKYANLYFVFEDFSFNMSALGSGVDFFCYLGLSSRYRKTICRLVGCQGKVICSRTQNENNDTKTDEISTETRCRSVPDQSTNLSISVTDAS